MKQERERLALSQPLRMFAVGCVQFPISSLLINRLPVDGTSLPVSSSLTPPHRLFLPRQKMLVGSAVREF